MDDETEDTVLWIRPQNALGGGIIGPIVQDVGTFGLAMIAAPIACLISLVSGSNCIDDAIDLAHQVEPVGLIDSAIPGIGHISGNDYTGLWHFINVEAASEGVAGDFNEIPGMHYMDGGWRGGPSVLGVGRIDALDYGIITLGDSTGLSLNPGASGGVKRYQQSPDGKLTRRKADWLFGLGHVEFEPLDNLALFGWKDFRATRRVSGLGWVLHAIGDSVAPHHTIAATGWGHRLYEDFASERWRLLLTEGSPALYRNYARILEQGYRWWKFIDDWQQAHGGTTDVPVRELITNSAFETRTNTWAFKNGVSAPYAVDDDHETAVTEYHAFQAETSELMHRGLGITLAFLTKAARAVPASTGTSPCACEPGFGRGDIPGAGYQATCVNCADRGLVELDGACVIACPADKPLLGFNQNRCEAVCSDTGCNGIACPPEVPFVVQTGTGDESPVPVECSESCDGVVVGGRECKDSCPANYLILRGTNFCIPKEQCKFPKFIDALSPCDCSEDAPFRANNGCFAACPEELPFFVNESGVLNCVSECPRRTGTRGESNECVERPDPPQ